MSMLDPCLVFLTLNVRNFDVDQIEKVSQHHPIKLPSLRVICLKKSRNFTDLRMLRVKWDFRLIMI